MYKPDYKKSFEKELKNILKNYPNYKIEIKTFINLILENPFRIDIDRKKLQGKKKKLNKHNFRFRKGKFRITTTINKKEKVIQFKEIGLRNDFYN